jgi:hypothetical protein
MLRLFSVIAVALGAFFLSGVFTMAISSLIVKPFGLHGYTYGQALAIDAAIMVSVIAGVIISTILAWLLDD